MSSFSSSTSCSNSTLASEARSLETLADDYPTACRPVYSYHILVRGALVGAANASLTSSEIILAIESKFPYFKQERAQICKSYILNTLSNTPCFSPNGSGPFKDELYWTYNPSKDHYLGTSPRQTSAFAHNLSMGTSTTTLGSSSPNSYSHALPSYRPPSDAWKELNFDPDAEDWKEKDYLEERARALVREREQERIRRRRRTNTKDSDELSGIILEKSATAEAMHVDLTQETMLQMKHGKRSKHWTGGYHDHGCCVIA